MNGSRQLSDGLPLEVRFVLHSDATFGRGAGLVSTVGMVDREIDHDGDGLPLLRGRTLKGLLNESAADILYSLGQIVGQESMLLARWQAAAARLFGGPGSDLNSQAWMDYRDAMLPPPLRAVIHYELHQREESQTLLQPSQLLNALTTIRRQTAMNEWGVPVAASLRAQRVVLRETPFVAELYYLPRAQNGDAFDAALSGAERQADDLALLAAAIRGWRRAGSTRNRGLGWLRASLHDGKGEDITALHFARFAQTIKEQQPR